MRVACPKCGQDSTEQVDMSSIAFGPWKTYWLRCPSGHLFDPIDNEGPSIELRFATVEQLINELMSRQTFRGLIAFQRDSFKGQPKSEWGWRANNCDGRIIAKELSENMPDPGLPGDPAGEGQKL